MHKLIIISAFLFISILILSCQPAVDMEKEKTAVLQVHQDNIKALEDEDIELFVSIMSDPFYTISEGKVDTVTADSMRKNLSKMFKNNTFSDITDVIEPIVYVSADGKTAWLIDNLQTTYTRKTSAGNDTTSVIRATELATLQKEGSKWLFNAFSEKWKMLPAEK